MSSSSNTENQEKLTETMIEEMNELYDIKEELEQKDAIDNEMLIASLKSVMGSLELFMKLYVDPAEDKEEIVKNVNNMIEYINNKIKYLENESKLAKEDLEDYKTRHQEKVVWQPTEKGGSRKRKAKKAKRKTNKRR
jgi:hypothetical protein